MYFNPEPKTERKDLFGAEYAVTSFLNSLNDKSTRMVIIKGLRRTGKTSLLNVGLKESGKATVKIDVRQGPYQDRKEFLSFIIAQIRKKLDESLFQRIMKKISGVSVGYRDFSATVFLSKEENAGLFFESLNGQLPNPLILAFDEIQLAKDIGFDYFLASIFDNYTNIKLVLTGSEMGLLDAFLGKKDYDAPLYGRACFEIELKRLKEEGTASFLHLGFAEIHKQISFEETRNVIEHLDGIIGWLTLYGWLRYQDVSHLKAIQKVKEEGKETVKRELDNFLTTRRATSNYIKLLHSLLQGQTTWSALKASFRKQKIHLSDGQLQLYLNELQDYGFIENSSEGYIIADPLLAVALQK